jgi:hypothetical protein
MQVKVISTTSTNEFESDLASYLDRGWTLHGPTQVTFLEGGIDHGRVKYTQVLLKLAREDHF